MSTVDKIAESVTDKILEESYLVDEKITEIIRAFKNKYPDFHIQVAVDDFDNVENRGNSSIHAGILLTLKK